ncbi:MAG: Enhancing lycopene biosynthesis protein 2 [candidate division BRC1 bacterium ADurb.BinA364]|nr:MAG: Enhancing lycopene biosynthesis protein 2 [candidate division BRC1 bacterium ADurb.BinA364]
MKERKPRFAVVLSGCGVFDGSEIHEAVLTMLAIARQRGEYVCFAPDVPQKQTIDHLTKRETAESRNILAEAARIARGRIAPLADFDASEFDALVFPGGFGAAKNLSTFAFDGPRCTVDPYVESAIAAMREARKPIGAMCIAPVLLAKTLAGVEVTIGRDSETAGALEKMGARHVNAGPVEVVVDARNQIATTPCYMLDSDIAQVAQGAENLIKALLAMM